MTKVTNKHNTPLNVAGKDVRPGASVEVDDGAFKRWSLGNAAKIWLEQGLVVSDAKGGTKAKKDDTPLERVQLEALAASLGIDFSADTSDEDLANAISEAQEEAGKNERENLLKEARDLGLNPNANISTEKLRKQVADKKAAQ